MQNQPEPKKQQPHSLDSSGPTGQGQKADIGDFAKGIIIKSGIKDKRLVEEIAESIRKVQSLPREDDRYFSPTGNSQIFNVL